jgi:uncharacterized membrane protein
MTQRQITNHKSNNLFVLVGGTKVLTETILKFRQAENKRSYLLLHLLYLFFIFFIHDGKKDGLQYYLWKFLSGSHLAQTPPAHPFVWIGA